MNVARSVAPTGDLAQVAALPLTIGDDGVMRVLLLTSRETKRWVIPKGWPMKGRKPYEAAAQEALEEAGVIGQAKKKPIGSYIYFKRREAHFDVCRVDVYRSGGRKAAQELAGERPTRSSSGSRSTKRPTWCTSRDLPHFCGALRNWIRSSNESWRTRRVRDGSRSANSPWRSCYRALIGLEREIRARRARVCGLYTLVGVRGGAHHARFQIWVWRRV